MASALPSSKSQRSSIIGISKIAENHCGLTLLELLIVLVISSLLINQLFTLYLHSKEHHIQHSAEQTMSEEMGFVNLLLEQAVAGAGYLGYLGWENIPVFDPAENNSLPMKIYASGDSRIPENIQKKMKPGTQAIALKQMDFQLSSLVQKTNAGSSEIFVKNNSIHWDKEDKIIMADYQHAEINTILSVHALSSQEKSIQLTSPLHDAYEKNAYIGHYFERLYFIGDTGHKFPDKQKIYGLYVYSENGMTEEITDLASDMQIDLSASNLLHISLCFTLPYWVNGKIFSQNQEFFIAVRE